MGTEMPGNASPAQDKLDAIGLEGICERISGRESLTAIAQTSGVSIGSLLTWIESTPERSARVRETRSAIAKLWDEEAERIIRDAPDEFELKRAKELSHHYRWRAAKVAPREYGDKVEVDARHSGNVGFQLSIGRRAKSED